MTWLNCLADPDAVFIADTSVLINLNATGRAADILGGLPCRFAVPENVSAELENGRRNGYHDADALDELCKQGHAHRVNLGEDALTVYESLIDGSTLRTLDDGEASTIGCAVELSGVALIDERKARLLCSEMYPELAVVSTAGLLTSDLVRNLLEESGQANALLNALRIARMRVPKELVSRVCEIIGPEAAMSCTSLPREVRSRIWFNPSHN
ncbi:hypothetical protein K1T73_15990 [Roseovarius sp. SCSIO 43702]|uniref:hypothetical protein n=1 Tax=Roseovarius sp. SCSIO 43702 TaxID=2823043 RepID=UPI001C73C4E9|nr:hypothetical protein [Roseovarius sp. SCSIO 43702]QYX56526.1 hypothetical protein K1T73_15990 [Roseovarius sp. SCSIO 43702]